MWLFYTKCSEPWAIILTFLYHGENKIHLDEMMMISVLYQNNTHSWILKVLAHWNNNMREDMSLYPDSSQPVISLTHECRVLSRESTNINFVVSNHQSIVREASMLTITPPMWLTKHWEKVPKVTLILRYNYTKDIDWMFYNTSTCYVMIFVQVYCCRKIM